MIRFMFITVVLAAALGWLHPARAGDFDGGQALLCRAAQGHEWHVGGNDKAFNPESVGLPHTFVIDFKNKRIRPTRESVVRKRTKIMGLGHVEDKLMLQGMDEGVEGVIDGIGWSMSLSSVNGAFVISAAGDRVGYVVFGSCVAK